MSRRPPSKRARETIALLERDGWELARYCGTGHIQFRHRATGALVVTSATPSGRRQREQVLASARRALRDWEAGRGWT